MYNNLYLKLNKSFINKSKFIKNLIKSFGFKKTNSLIKFKNNSNFRCRFKKLINFVKLY